MMWVEDKFDLNDYFVIFALIISWGIYYFLPKVFSKQMTTIIFLYSLTAAGLFDNSIGAEPFDFYDIMDGPAYTVMDVVVYFLYPPFSYLFLFIYKKLQIKDRYLLVFILCFTATAIAVEWAYYKMGVFHYKNGNSTIFCLYLSLHSIAANFLISLLNSKRTGKIKKPDEFLVFVILKNFLRGSSSDLLNFLIDKQFHYYQKEYSLIDSQLLG